MRPQRASLLASAAFVLAWVAPAQAITVFLTPTKDNTLYETLDGSLSNGSGQHLFAGATGGGAKHRGLVAFDIAGAIPAGSSVQAVTLKLHMSRSNNPSAQTVSLHRVLADWGEGTSDALGNEGSGALSEAGDATWLHRFHPDIFWASSGGDFVPMIGASQTVSDTGLYSWSGPLLVSDVQGWLNSPTTNFGWLVTGNETAAGTSKRFDSRENPEPAVRPVLEVEYTPAVPGLMPLGFWVLTLALGAAALGVLRHKSHLA